jgi:TldD protein
MLFDTTLTRRHFIQHGSTVLLAGMVGGRIQYRRIAPAHLPDSVRDAEKGTLDPALVHSLAMQSLDAARAAGATYADVRLTRTIQEDLGASWATEAWQMTDREELALGVRAFVQGYWGFASTPYWTAEEAVRVGTMAAAQAAINAKGPAQSVVLGHIPVVTGNWQTPITIDPFRLSMEEKLDYLRATIVAARQMLPQTVRSGEPLQLGVVNSFDASFYRQECALATSEGSYLTQTLYQAKGALPISYRKNTSREFSNDFIVHAQGLTQAGKGWELLTEAKVLDQLPGMLDALEAQPSLPWRPVEVGRMTIICDAATTAGVLDATLGRATEVDRALGYEANATGTSYLGPDPLATLGTAVASPLVTVTANRSLPGGLATVKWDAEGCTPDDFSLVHAGILVDYQTTREQAAWLAPWYHKNGTPVHSHGCANASDASYVTMQMAPNLALVPASGGVGFEEMVAGVTNGIALEGCTTVTDVQCRSGTISEGAIYHVRQGKRVARLVNTGVLFDTPGLWKNVTALGGTANVAHLPLSEAKGEPSQSTMHTVSSVPIEIKEMALVDLTRKA